MFNLEQATAEWRRQMLAAGIKTPVPLEELEIHLREDVEQQIRAGTNERQAFEIAVERIGDAVLIKKEFGKIGTTQRRNMIRTIAILAALFGMVFGLAMILPALGQRSRTGGVLHRTNGFPVSGFPGRFIARHSVRSLTDVSMWSAPLALGTALVLVGGIASFYSIRTHKDARGRRVITLAVVGAGFFYAMPLILAFFQSRKTDLIGWLFCALLAATAVVFFGACLRFNRRIPA